MKRFFAGISFLAWVSVTLAARFPISDGVLQSHLNGGGFALTNVADIKGASGQSLFLAVTNGLDSVAARAVALTVVSNQTLAVSNSIGAAVTAGTNGLDSIAARAAADAAINTNLTLVAVSATNSATAIGTNYIHPYNSSAGALDQFIYHLSASGLSYTNLNGNTADFFTNVGGLWGYKTVSVSQNTVSNTVIGLYLGGPISPISVAYTPDPTFIPFSVVPLVDKTGSNNIVSLINAGDAAQASALTIVSNQTLATSNSIGSAVSAGISGLDSIAARAAALTIVSNQTLATSNSIGSAVTVGTNGLDSVAARAAALTSVSNQTLAVSNAAVAIGTAAATALTIVSNQVAATSNAIPSAVTAGTNGLDSVAARVTALTLVSNQVAATSNAIPAAVTAGTNGLDSIAARAAALTLVSNRTLADLTNNQAGTVTIIDGVGANSPQLQIFSTAATNANIAAAYIFQAFLGMPQGFIMGPIISSNRYRFQLSSSPFTTFMEFNPNNPVAPMVEVPWLTVDNLRLGASSSPPIETVRSGLSTTNPLTSASLAAWAGSDPGLPDSVLRQDMSIGMGGGASLTNFLTPLKRGDRLDLAVIGDSFSTPDALTTFSQIIGQIAERDGGYRGYGPGIGAGMPAYFSAQQVFNDFWQTTNWVIIGTNAATFGTNWFTGGSNQVGVLFATTGMGACSYKLQASTNFTAFFDLNTFTNTPTTTNAVLSNYFILSPGACQLRIVGVTGTNRVLGVKAVDLSPTTLKSLTVYDLGCSGTDLFQTTNAVMESLLTQTLTLINPNLLIATYLDSISYPFSTTATAAIAHTNQWREFGRVIAPSVGGRVLVLGPHYHARDGLGDLNITNGNNSTIETLAIADACRVYGLAMYDPHPIWGSYSNAVIHGWMNDNTHASNLGGRVAANDFFRKNGVDMSTPTLAYLNSLKPCTTDLSMILNQATFDSGPFGGAAGWRFDANSIGTYWNSRGVIGYRTNVTTFYFVSTNLAGSAWNLQQSFGSTGYPIPTHVDLTNGLQGIANGTPTVISVSFTNSWPNGNTNDTVTYRMINSGYVSTNTIWMFGTPKNVWLP